LPDFQIFAGKFQKYLFAYCIVRKIRLSLCREYNFNI